ncbi:MAG TPA: hypothetical protein VLZ44_00030 [Treponemataceae bacterium]|nr:hypothetical protein [Treponemataceae bacterium]
MKKNLIFKLCFIVGIFLIILTACDLGTKQWANITFNLEGPAIEQARANSGASSSARYIHPDADYLIFELFSGNTSLSKTTQSITDGKDISIRLEKVPLNDPNLRAEIKVWGTKPGDTDPSILGENTIHLGRIGLGYTKLTLGVKPVEKDLKTVKYESGVDGTNLTYTPRDSSAVWKIQMYQQKGLYTIEAYESRPELYASDGRVYKNTHPIQTGTEDDYTLVFYHPKDEASTYYLASSSNNEFYINSGTKLEQKILVTQKSNDENDEYDEILGNPDDVKFETVYKNNPPKTLSFTIYNPYSQALSFTTKFEKETGELDGDTIPGNDKFSTEDFPASLPPGGRRDFDIIFTPTNNDEVFADFTIQAEGLGNFVLELSGSGSGF